MEDNITKFPGKPKSNFIIGPFQEWRVVVDGRCIPNLTAHREGPDVWLTVDHRITAGPFDEAAAYQAAVLAANAMAVAQGYSHSSAETKEQPFAPKVSFLGTIDGEDSTQ